jgi:hypothetical protein
MSKRINTIAAAVLAAGLVAGTAATASAHVVGGTPTPAPSQQTVTPTPSPDHHRVQARPWQFDFDQLDIGANHVNDFEATAPLLAAGWTDTQLNPFTDKFHDATGDSVTLRHSPIFGANVSVNLQTCTVTLDQTGRFSIIADTGTDAGFRSVPGSGQFVLNAMFSFNLRNRSHNYSDYRHHLSACPLAGLSNGTILRAITLGGSLLPQPTMDNVSVQGEASVFQVTPPIHIFAPTVSPTDSASA